MAAVSPPPSQDPQADSTDAHEPRRPELESPLQVKERTNHFKRDVWGNGVFAFNSSSMLLARRLVAGGKDVWSGRVKPGGIKVVPWKIGRRNHRFDVVLHTAHGEEVLSLAASTEATLASWAVALHNTWPPSMELVLKEADLLSILPALRDLGAESAEDFKSLTDEDLEELGMSPAECTRFFDSVNLLLSHPPKPLKLRSQPSVKPASSPKRAPAPRKTVRAMQKRSTAVAPWNDRPLPTMERVLFLTETMHVLPKLHELGAEVFEDLSSLTPTDFTDLDVTTPEMERIQAAVQRVADGTFEDLAGQEAFWNHAEAAGAGAGAAGGVLREADYHAHPKAIVRRKTRAVSCAHAIQSDSTNAAVQRVVQMESSGALSRDQAALLVDELGVPNFTAVKICTEGGEADIIHHVERLHDESCAFLALDGRRRASSTDGTRVRRSPSGPAARAHLPAVFEPSATLQRADSVQTTSQPIDRAVRLAPTPPAPRSHSAAMVGILKKKPGDGAADGVGSRVSPPPPLEPPATTPGAEPSNARGRAPAVCLVAAEPSSPPGLRGADVPTDAGDDGQGHRPADEPGTDGRDGSVEEAGAPCAATVPDPQHARAEQSRTSSDAWTRVAFSHVEIRHFTCTVGAGVPCDDGPAVGLGWTWLAPLDDTLPVDAAEELAERAGRLCAVDFAAQRHLAPDERVEKLLMAGHRRPSVDLNAELNHITRVKRRLSGMLPGSTAIMNGMQPDEAMERDQVYESAMQLQPLLLNWFRTAARNSMVRNPSVFMSLSQRSTRLERSIRKHASL